MWVKMKRREEGGFYFRLACLLACQADVIFFAGGKDGIFSFFFFLLRFGFLVLMFARFRFFFLIRFVMRVSRACVLLVLVAFSVVFAGNGVCLFGGRGVVGDNRYVRAGFFAS